MSYLILAIFASVSVSIFLKLVRVQNIDVRQAILINYMTAIFLALLFLKPDFSQGLPKFGTAPSFIFIALGVLLPSVFIIMAKAVDCVGIVKSDAAQRLALFLPIIASFTIFNEVLTTQKAIGITLAFLALFLLVYKENIQKSYDVKSSIMVLLGVWLGYGVIDILFKQMSKLGNAFSVTLLITFVLAFVIMLGYLLIKRTAWQAKSLGSGVILGILNFSNILFYVKTHQAFKSDPTLVFAGMNIGVICLGTLVGLFLFKEKVSKINLSGVMIGMIAIWCLFYLQ